MMNFWNELKQPVFALAPMEDVTDTVFRELVTRLSAPGALHVVYTEFTSVDGMNHPTGKKRVGERLVVGPPEREILQQKGIRLVAQLWGKNPEIFHKVAKEITEQYEFDGLDINMGCPVKKIVKNGCCSALIGQPELATEIIHAVKEATDLPVSVKTRTGIRIHETERWISQLLAAAPAAIILHGRRQVQQSDGPADWDEIRKAATIRDQLAPDIPIIGNGDVLSYRQGLEYSAKYGVNGIMIGRGIFHNPWFFNPVQEEKTVREKLDKLVLHTRLFEAAWGETKNFNILKRFFKIYTQNFPEAARLRSRLMEARNYGEVYELTEKFLSKEGDPMSY
ncbi:MAG: tRNA-dihydrouridine synthase [Prolixibacteraceae bacterium]|nr:tRNA-dihydrouridine synthase [Prolixibacteraceae bacterium]